MLGVAKKPIMLSVVLLNVVKLSVELSIIQRAAHFVGASHAKCKDAVVNKSS